MRKLLFTQKEVLKRLTDNNLVTFKKASFSEAVKIGVIPYTREDGVKQKMYDYDEVAKAILQAGIGNPPTHSEELDNLPPPEQGQSKEEYGELIVKALNKKPTLTDANIYNTLYKGKLEKLKYEREVGLLISKVDVEDKAFTVSRAIRDKILTIPERMSNELASMNNPHEVKELLYKEFNILLDGFSKDSFL